MIKIAIVDDEEQTREQILQTLKENIQEQHEVEIKLYVLSLIHISEPTRRS